MDFSFKRFSLHHDRSTMKVGTDAMLLVSLCDTSGARRVLDVGCGCGVVAFCAAQQAVLKSVNPVVFGIDPDAASIAEARQNAASYPLLPAENLHFEQATIQEFAQQWQGAPFDYILSNPPFYHNDLKPDNHSRRQSRHGDGNLPFADLLEGVLKILADEGRFSLILPVREGEAFDALACQSLTCVRRVTVQPTERKPAHRVVLSYARTGSPCEEERLVIRDAANRYTEAYLRLMEPYLLV
ncbi:MAG: methyltransferase domain-containing protein [Bacteroidales bacterium]|nr:methyltransferase domain-containing protein [Bacteroidales bacterium]